MHNVPVQVDGRIVDCVDPCHADAMSRAKNVQIVRARRGKIVRVIVEPTVRGDGDIGTRSSGQSSLQTLVRAKLFTGDDAHTGNIAGMPFVFEHNVPSTPKERKTSTERQARPASRRKRSKK